MGPATNAFRRRLRTGFFAGILTLLLSAPSARAAYEKETSLRGAEREESRFLDPLGNAFAVATYVPRKALNGALHGAGHAAAKLSDEDFIRRVKDILYFYDEKILWYPIFQLDSGFQSAYGVGVLYKEGSWQISSKAVIKDSDFWSYSVKPSYQFETPLGDLKNSVLAVAEKKDDRRFYGLGADPKKDPRNTFLGDNDYGVYTETRQKLQWESSLQRPSRAWSATYLGYYQRRHFEDHGRGNDDVREIFDLSRIPGFDAPVKQLYNELSLEIDTRDQKRILAPGFRSELYSGFSAGFGKNDADLFRTGFDAAGFVPVLRENRIFVPRVVADLVHSMNDKEIPFSEYPRQRTFRGVSNRDLIRSEKVSIVPSVEYRWPLSHMFGGHVFCDTLFVGPRAGDIRWEDGLWAAGIGFDFHLHKKELARTELAIGSEGVQFTITIGAPLKSNHRKDW